VQDAVNLGWKLAQVVNGTSPESLLDTYYAERHPVAARALKYTLAQAELQRGDERITALVDVLSELATMREPRKWLAGLISGLDIHYDLGEGHPLLGRRMPDFDLITAYGPPRRGRSTGPGTPRSSAIPMTPAGCGWCSIGMRKATNGLSPIPRSLPSFRRPAFKAHP
jgi:hypothetical protein